MKTILLDETDAEVQQNDEVFGFVVTINRPTKWIQLEFPFMIEI